LEGRPGDPGAAERTLGPAARKVLTMDLLTIVKQLVEGFFTSTVNVQPGLLFLLFFVGLMLGWFFGH
jgi:hypothetical protein